MTRTGLWCYSIVGCSGRVGINDASECCTSSGGVGCVSGIGVDITHCLHALWSAELRLAFHATN